MESLFKNIKLLILDVDGVLTNGGIIYTDDAIETKIFNVRDGLGLRLLMNAGIQVGIITGRASKALRSRCADLGIEHLYEGAGDKVPALDDVLRKTGVSKEETAFIGDDLPDLPVLTKVGVPIAVGDAADEVKQHAAVVTRANGGDGAVREISEAILKARGLWGGIVETFLM